MAVDLAEHRPRTWPGPTTASSTSPTQAGWAASPPTWRDGTAACDGLVANAGITWRARLADVTPADLRRVHEVNVTGTLLGIQALTPLMTAGGSIVMVGSVAALTGHYPVAYTASKWALRGLAKAACLELGPRGIRVNTVHPGYIETPDDRLGCAGVPGREPRRDPARPHRHRRRGRAARRFLLSDDASFITGAEIPVDGGMTAHGGVKSISDAVPRRA